MGRGKYSVISLQLVEMRGGMFLYFMDSLITDH